MKNPVIIANHIYKIENIVGKATSIYVKENQLIILNEVNLYYKGYNIIILPETYVTVYQRNY